MRRWVVGLVCGVAACGPQNPGADGGGDGEGDGTHGPADGGSTAGLDAGDLGPTTSGVGTDDIGMPTSDETGEAVTSWCVTGSTVDALDPEAVVLAIADVNADGTDEIWTQRQAWDPVAEAHTTTVQVLTNGGAVEAPMQTLADYDVDGQVDAVADIDGNGTLDLVVAGWDRTDSWWLAGTTDAQVDPTPRSLMLPPSLAVLLDSNGDGITDAVTRGSDVLTFHIGTGDGGFSEGALLPIEGLGKLQLLDSGIPGQPMLFTAPKVLGFGDDRVTVRQLAVDAAGQVDVLRTIDELDIEAASVLDLDDDGIAEVIGHDGLHNVGPIVLRAARPSTYEVTDFADATHGVVAGAFASAQSIDLLSWSSEDDSLVLRRWDADQWTAAVPVAIDGPWDSAGRTWTVRSDQDGGQRFLQKRSTPRHPYTQWRLHACDQ